MNVKLKGQVVLSDYELIEFIAIKECLTEEKNKNISL